MASSKLCVTVGEHLKAKYSAAERGRIDAAVAKWIKADAVRGITTVCVALDDAKEMKRLGAAAITGKATAVRVKRAVDALCRLFAPEYLVILGGNDIVPYFRVANPSLDPVSGDDDSEVVTDNPYACSAPYRAADRKSYLVPDRVIGRITDLDDDPDPRWLIDQLARASAWSPKPKDFFTPAYAVCCSTWGPAGEACMRHVGLPVGDLMISPPTVDATSPARERLARKLHMIKCHGGALEAAYAGQRGNSYPDVLTSATIKGRITDNSLVAAMCCYGAQIYSPRDPAAKPPMELPVAAAYLREGALAMMGATKIAWVGVRSMQCADWIVCGYVKAALAGASIGRALQEAKQDYVRWLETEGQAPDLADEKTLIEFILLGDPSVHPTTLSPTPARAAAAGRAAAAVGERAQRRAVRTALAGQIRRNLPLRTASRQAPPEVARRLFSLATSSLEAEGLAAPSTDPTQARASHLRSSPEGLVARLLGSRLAATARPRGGRESVEYYWSSRQQVQGRTLVHLLKVEADKDGNFLRSRLLHSA
jgi:hypothetical protein